MLNLIVNGEPVTLREPCVLTQALREMGREDLHFAVAVDGTFVPRHAYATFPLKGGERLELLAPMQGG